MELAKYLGKGIWGLADKALPVLYGVAFVVLVIRVLPEEEFGNFVLVQEIFLIISGLAQGFALQPLLKYAAEEDGGTAGIVSAGLVLNTVFTIVCGAIVVLSRDLIAALLNSPLLSPLLLLLPAMLAASLLRNFTLVLLQARFHIREIFWTDAVHFLGAPALVYGLSKLNRFDTAYDLIIINVISMTASSLVGMWYSRSLFTFRLAFSRDEVAKLWNYGTYSLGGIVSYLFTTRADSFILAAFTGPVQVAVYNSVKVFARLYDMVTQVVQMFVFPATSMLSSKRQEGQLTAALEKSILFSTVGMIPVFLILLTLASPLLGVLYGSRYAEAIPLLQIFSLLSFVVPAAAVASSVLLGLGHARLVFLISVQSLIAAVALYLACIPMLGPLGATIGYILASVVFAWLNVRHMRRFVPLTLRAVLARTNDIKQFLKTHLRRA